MSSSTATIPSNNNDRKRSISSSIRPSPSPPSAKRHGLASNARRITNKNKRSSERPSRSKQKYRHLDNKSSSSESSRSSSDSNHRDDPSSPIDIQSKIHRIICIRKKNFLFVISKIQMKLNERISMVIRNINQH